MTELLTRIGLLLESFRPTQPMWGAGFVIMKIADAMKFSTDVNYAETGMVPA